MSIWLLSKKLQLPLWKKRYMVSSVHFLSTSIISVILRSAIKIGEFLSELMNSKRIGISHLNQHFLQSDEFSTKYSCRKKTPCSTSLFSVFSFGNKREVFNFCVTFPHFPSTSLTEHSASAGISQHLYPTGTTKALKAS